MSATAYKFAGTVSDPNAKWNNDDYVKAEDDACADCNCPKQTGHPLVLTNFGFSADDIPAGATINGIEFVIGRYCNMANEAFDSSLYLQFSGADVGSNMASAAKWPANGVVEDVTYGGATNMCGTSLTRSNILDSSFGIEIIPLKTASDSAVIANIDFIKIRVHYTVSTGKKDSFFPFFSVLFSFFSFSNLFFHG